MRILNSPNHCDVKGTEFLLAAVQALRTEGLSIYLLLLERMQNCDVLALRAPAEPESPPQKMALAALMVPAMRTLRESAA